MKFPVEFRFAQKKVGITFDNRDAVLSEISPRSEKQTELRTNLERLISNYMTANAEDRKNGLRAMIVYGAEGRGKSYLCSGAVNEIMRLAYNKENEKENPQFDTVLEGVALYLTHYELDLQEKSCMSPKAPRTQYEQYQRVTGVPFLVIDEIGRGSWSDYSAQNIENVISKRYAQCLPTVLITNKTTPEIVKMFDRSTRDRLFNGKTGIGIDMDDGQNKSFR